ncbi:YslB family protein [Leuconostocaceae bacterium ESL0723]|nr:YslB family protein [Leuconostocaceae bacterium ESL0723]
MNNQSYRQMLKENQDVNTFAVTLLRDALLSNLLQSDYDSITYWAGKELARQFPLETLDDIKTFFYAAGLGEILLSAQSSTKQTWRLSGVIVDQRLKINPDQRADFSLEAGFLAQQLESQTGTIAEASYHYAGRNKGITIVVVTDLNQKVDRANPSQQVALRDNFLQQAQDNSAGSETATPQPTASQDSTPAPAKDSPAKSQTTTEASHPIQSEAKALASDNPSEAAQQSQSQSVSNSQSAAQEAPDQASTILASFNQSAKERQSTTETSESAQSEADYTADPEQSITDSLLAFNFGSEAQPKHNSDQDK